MKAKTILIAFAMFASCGLLRAQEEKPLLVTARVGIGTPGAGKDYFTEGRGGYTTGLAGIYGDYYGPSRTSGTITADVFFQVKDWLQCGVALGFGYYTNTLYNGVTDEVQSSRKGYAMHAIPMVKTSYLNTRIVTLYAGGGIGIAKYAGFDNLKSSTTFTIDGRTYSEHYDHTLKFEAQFVPFGIEVGTKIFGFAEFCLGTMVHGVRAGIGYNF